MPRFHHRPLPDHSALLAGSRPADDAAFASKLLQIWFNRTDEAWRDPAPHYHTASDEAFIVLKGAIIVEVEGERIRVAEDELCAFPAGVMHSVVDVEPPVESLIESLTIRAPSVSDKVYVEAVAMGAADRERDRP